MILRADQKVVEENISNHEDTAIDNIQTETREIRL